MRDVRIVVQCATKLRIRRPFDDRDRRLRHVALRQLREKLGQRDPLLDLVAAGLDRAVGALDAGKGGERERVREDAFGVQGPCDARKRRARTHVEIVRTSRQRQRPAIPGVADRRERHRAGHEQQNEKRRDAGFAHAVDVAGEACGSAPVSAHGAAMSVIIMARMFGSVPRSLHPGCGAMARPMSAKGRPERELRPLRGQRSGGAASAGVHLRAKGRPERELRPLRGQRSGGAASAGVHLRAKGRPERELRPLRGQRSGGAASVGVHLRAKRRPERELRPLRGQRSGRAASVGGPTPVRGFTLIEIMVVIVILGVLAALVVPSVLSRTDDARIVAAKTDIGAIRQALKLYRLDNQRYPTTEQGLSALVTMPTQPPIPPNWKPGGYLEKLPVDPWGRPYQYLNPGLKGEVDVFTYGADGQPGGTGADADIGSWDL